MPEIRRGEAAGRGGVVEWDGCERVFVPVFKELDYSPESLTVRFKDYASDGTEVSFGKCSALISLLQKCSGSE